MKERLELLQETLLDLPNPLAAYTELVSEGLQSLRVFGDQPVFEDLLFLVLE